MRPTQISLLPLLLRTGTRTGTRTSIARPFTVTATNPQNSRPKDHITNSSDTLDVHSEAAKSGARDRRSDGAGGEGSQAATERDQRRSSDRVKEEMPEAPEGPVIGMNDERGPKGH